MSIDLTAVSELALRVIEKIEKDTAEGVFPGGDAVLVDALLVVEVSGVDEDGDTVSGVMPMNTADRTTIGIGLATRALKAYSDPDED